MVREGLRSGKGEISSGKVLVQKALPELIIVPKDDESSRESTEIGSFSEVKSEKRDASGDDCNVGEGIDGCQMNGILQYKRKRARDDNGEGCVCLGEEDKLKKKVKVEILEGEVQNVGRVLRSGTRASSDFKKEVEIAESGCTEIDISGGQSDNLKVKRVTVEDDGATQLVEGLVEQKVKKKRGRPPKIYSKIGVVKTKFDRIKKMGAPRKSKRMLRSKGSPNRVVAVSSSKRSTRLKGISSSLKILSPAKLDEVKNLETGGNLALSQESSEIGSNEDNVVKVKRDIIKNEKSEGEGLTRATKKQLVRDHIIELLLSAGWTIDYRPRFGSSYDDAVYVSPDGKTHWSVTKAYRLLKQRYEDGDREAYKDGFIFSPIPAEELGILNRIVTKKREAKRTDGGPKGKKAADRALRKKKLSSGMTSSGKPIKRKKKRKSWPCEEDESTMEACGHTPWSFGKRKRRDTKRSKRCVLLVRSSGGEDLESSGYVLYKGKRTSLSWMIDLGIVLEKANVSYMNQRKTRVMLEGKIAKDGIDCSCCGKVITILEFESHAGSKLCQPLQNTYLHDGISIYQCLLDAWRKQEKLVQQKWFYYIDINGDDTNDDTCGLCGDGGNLVCCDGCPSTFHQSCLDIQKFPPGDWHCLFCCCKFCGMIFGNANEREEDDKAASLLLTCGFCKERYHRSCSDAKDEGFPSFCGKKCQEISGKAGMLLGVKHEMEEGFSWTLLHRSDVDVDLPAKEISREVECNCKIAVALSVMDECFLPMPDHRSGINLIRNIMYNCGSNFNRLDFSGFYTVTLEKGEEIVAAASIRIHGNILAEMPFIGTRYMYRRQGMCRRLLSAIESVLCCLDVGKLVIPAVSDLEETWTSAFGFEPLDMETQKIVRRLNLLVFPRVAMLQKLVTSDGFSREKPSQEAEGRSEDDQTTGDVIFGGNCPVKFDLNAAPEDTTVDLHAMEGEAPPAAAVKSSSCQQLQNGSSNETSDITTESIRISNCAATDDHRENLPSGEPSCDALESKSNNGSDQLAEDIDAPPVVDENGTSTSEATPLNVNSGGMNHEEEDVSDMKSSDCGGCLSEDITNVVAPLEIECGDQSEVPTLEAPLEVDEGGTNDGGTLDVNTAECGDQPLDVESINNEKRVDLEGKNNHDIVLDGGGTNDGGTSNVNNTEDTLAASLEVNAESTNHEMRVDLEGDNNHKIVLAMKSSNHEEGQLEVINTARAAPHEEEGTMSHREEDTSLIPRPVAVEDECDVTTMVDAVHE